MVLESWAPFYTDKAATEIREGDAGQCQRLRRGEGFQVAVGAPGAMLPSPSWCLREAAQAANGEDARASLAELRTRHSSFSACGCVSREKFGVLGGLMLGGVPGGG